MVRTYPIPTAMLSVIGIYPFRYPDTRQPLTASIDGGHMTITIQTIYGNVPFLIWVSLNVKLKQFANEAWTGGYSGKRKFVNQYVDRYLQHERHPNVSVDKVS
jgi:hypothetical protein